MRERGNEGGGEGGREGGREGRREERERGREGGMEGGRDGGREAGLILIFVVHGAAALQWSVYAIAAWEIDGGATSTFRSDPAPLVAIRFPLPVLRSPPQNPWLDCVFVFLFS